MDFKDQCHCEDTGKVVSQNGEVYWQWFCRHTQTQKSRRIPILAEPPPEPAIAS